jgi:hypothetical protein
MATRKTKPAKKPSTTFVTKVSKAKPRAKKTMPASANTDTVRRVKIPKRKFYKRQEKRFRARPKLPSSFKLTAGAWRLIRDHWKVIGGIMLVYGLLNLVLVRGISGGLNVSELKSETDSLFHGFSGHIASSFTIFGLLISSSGNVASAASSAYQTFLLIIVSLAVVWSYRQLLAGNAIRIRDGFYQGMQPLVPVILVLMVVSVQILPLLLGAWVYVSIVNGSIAVTAIEQISTIIISLLLMAWSVYMLCSSLFALYIAALPGMTPLRALRSARELVRYRRWSLIRKLLFLPLILSIICVLVMLPIILVVPVIAQWVFFVLSTVALGAIHAYLYTLYRELISD